MGIGKISHSPAAVAPRRLPCCGLVSGRTAARLRGLVWFFQPYAEILHSARTVASASDAWYSMHFGGLGTLAATLGALEELFTLLHFWQAFLCALVALALFILVRGLLRLKSA